MGKIINTMVKMAEADKFVVDAGELVTLVEAHFTVGVLSMHNAGTGSRLKVEENECANSQLAKFLSALKEIDLGNRALRSLPVADLEPALDKIVLGMSVV